ncbi:unnamed protein product [Didymodactylos carnosus]|uniref:Uncharacterized protein n=1 Tax=Didymodactylos carnosus TaxID=1234261 RepID=A0A815EIW3_9BILA|nr:unnamed protein product [Didymodactylos carnosus]CAF1552421.1 unnamed protein product [Didymodactylos carnosus]CAF4151456.1 unnamed protein product [Didymodactylos carnosus]CAF4342798.1 unnamed protein product [Didymodactylos carnosus]
MSIVVNTQIQFPGTRPKIKVHHVTDTSAKIDTTPFWFDQIEPIDRRKICLPTNYDSVSPIDYQTIDCLSRYRTMESKKSLNFVNDPFQGTVNDSETLVIALNDVVQQCNVNLSFTNGNFKYDDSDYRIACGIADLGSIHSLIASGDNIQTAKFQFRFNLKYDDIVKTNETVQNFILRLLNAIAEIIQCQTQFVRVFSLDKNTSDEISVQFGVTAPQQNDTKIFAENLNKKASGLSQQNNVLSYVIPDNYKYVLEPAVSHLQLQKSDFDPKYNMDYRNYHTEEDQRGNRPYYFPIGWYRHALNVKDKYPNDELWLGMKNSSGEWSVAYHGTRAEAVKDITREGLLNSKTRKDACKQEAINQVGSIAAGNGIYLATHCQGGADMYTTTFQVKNKNGREVRYKTVFQCRVQPDKFTEHDFPVCSGKALRVYDEKAIRPYGILIKEEE